MTVPMISNCKDCTLSELSFLKKYLLRTPVGKDAVELINRGARVSRCEIIGLSEIGKLGTIWSTLDKIVSSKEYDQDKFFVNQILPVLKKYPSHDNNILLQKIEQLVASLEQYEGRLKDTTITLQQIGNSLCVIDGCHRTVAFYEYFSRRGIHDVNFPVYIITG